MSGEKATVAQGDHGPKDRMYRTAESEVLIEHWTTRVYFWAKGRRATAAWLLVRGVVHAARHREATEVELVVPVDKFSAVGRMPGLTAFMSRQAEFHDWVCVGSTRFFLRPQRTWVPGQLDLLTCGAPNPWRSRRAS